MFNLNKVPGWFWAILAVLVAMTFMRPASEGMETDQEARISRLEDFMDQAISDAQANDEEEYEEDGLDEEEQESME